MKTVRKVLTSGVLAFGVLAVEPTGGSINAANAAQKSSTSAPQETHNLAAGEAEVKRLLLLMDKDKNGKVSKQEFMAFMEAEFDRLDKDKSGQLDPVELTQFQFRTRQPFGALGK